MRTVVVNGKEEGKEVLSEGKINGAEGKIQR